MCSAVGWCGGVTNSLIVAVLLHHKSNPAVEVMVYALLDNASDTTFVTTAIKEKLELKESRQNSSSVQCLERKKSLFQGLIG